MVKRFLYRMNRLLIFKGKNKNGAMEIDEIIKLAFVLIVIVVMLIGISVLFMGKGGRLLESIQNMFRFGG